MGIVHRGDSNWMRRGRTTANAYGNYLESRDSRTGWQHSQPGRARPTAATYDAGAVGWAEAADTTRPCTMWPARGGDDAIGPCSAGPAPRDVEGLMLPGDPASKNIEPNAGLVVLSSTRKIQA
jgi:hypothetical protein